MQLGFLEFNVIEVTHHGKVQHFVINRESRRNSLDEPTVQQFRKLILEANQDSKTRAIVVSGAGSIAFCAGSDMKATQEMNLEERIEHALHGQQLMNELAESKLLTIAAVEGFALGGGFELALACDLIIAGDTAQFGLPEVHRGAVPSWGGTFRVTRAIGLAVAKQMILGGKKFSASEANQIGLVFDVVSHGNAVSAALDFADMITSACEREVFEAAKQLINEGLLRSDSENSEAEFEVEKLLCARETYGKLPD
jgi:enoyl-CoA hydratase